MMSVSQANTFKSEENNTNTMKVLALMVFVLLFFISTLAHADHLTTDYSNTVQQECHICHQGIDTPPELQSIQFSYAASYNLELQKITNVQCEVSYFVQPQLRAPPIFQ